MGRERVDSSDRPDVTDRIELVAEEETVGGRILTDSGMPGHISTDGAGGGGEGVMRLRAAVLRRCWYRPPASRRARAVEELPPTGRSP